MKKQFIRIVTITSLFLAVNCATAQTAVYHASLLGLSDGRITIQV